MRNTNPINGVTHHYLKLDKLSGKYDFETDLYSSFIIEIYGEAETKDGKSIAAYVDFISDNVSY